MAEKLSTGIAIDESVLQALSAWADEEYRSRNSLIEMILARAVEQRKAEARARWLDGEQHPMLQGQR